MSELLFIVSQTKVATDFLKAMYPEGPYHLVSMVPDGKPVAKTFYRGQEEEMHHWIESQQRKANLYFGVNTLRAGVKNRKAKKGDVAAVVFLHVDVDDLTVLDRLLRFEPRPTVILKSGNGYQAFWKLEAPLTDLALAERYNMWLARQLGGDNCHNVDRIMRLPGTINLPNAKKREAGKVPVLAELVEADWARVYGPESFELEPLQLSSTVVQVTGPIAAVGLDALPESISARIRHVVEFGDDPDQPRGTVGARYPSRSEAVFAVACALARAGCTEEVIAGVLLNPALGISEAIRSKRQPGAYALRQAAAAKAIAAKGWPDVDKSGGPRPTMRNAALACLRLGFTFRQDLFRNRRVVEGHLVEEIQGEVSDDVCTAVRAAIIERFDFDPRSDNVRDAITQLCLQHAFHPICDMLDSLVWDGTPRIDSWMASYLGAEQTPFIAAISVITLIAAVKRVREPGTKFDQITVLEGPQGTGKSTALSILAGPEYHSDQDILVLDAKSQIENLEGVWIYELGEVEGLNRGEVNKIKAFASRTNDRGRAAYARFSASRKRQVVFFGTTNEDKYLRDQTGNRRFWPVKTGKIDLDALRRDRDQLWAEAAHRERQGESIVLPEELWAAAAEEQAQRMEEDPWLDILSQVNGKDCGDIVQISTRDLLNDYLGIDGGRMNQGHTKRLSLLMRKLMWTATKYREEGKVVRGYQRPKPDDYKSDPVPAKFEF